MKARLFKVFKMGWKYWLPRQTLIVDLTFSSMEHVVRSVYLLFILKHKRPLVGYFSYPTDGIRGDVDFFNVIQLIKNWVALPLNHAQSA